MTTPEFQHLLSDHPERWLVTGGAGFIGSNLAQALLRGGQHVVVLDNYSTGSRANVAMLQQENGAAELLTVIEGDIRDESTCHSACEGIDYVLHQAALGSVPRSLKAPIASHAVNVTGTLNLLEASRLASVQRFVFASSSSVYGDDPGLPKIEEVTGDVLSPYAATKSSCEAYAKAYFQGYGLKTIGLRYFNVFGRHQSPVGAYAAVIPIWMHAMMDGQDVVIFGDGSTSRDFCYIDNVIQANFRAAKAPASATGSVYNIAYGATTTLNELAAQIAEALRGVGVDVTSDTVYRPFRKGDIQHSLAAIQKAKNGLGYAPSHSIGEGLREAVQWYVDSANG